MIAMIMRDRNHTIHIKRRIGIGDVRGQIGGYAHPAGKGPNGIDQYAVGAIINIDTCIRYLTVMFRQWSIRASWSNRFWACGICNAIPVLRSLAGGWF